MECIGSIVNQTYHNIEILLINDGSIDGSFTICEKWKEKDLRIKVYNNLNRGVSFSRNFGLGESIGEYIAFVDSDDVIASTYIETLVSILELNNADMAIVSYCPFRDGSVPKFTEAKEFIKINSNFEESFFTITQGTSCSKLYTKNNIKQNMVRFDENISVLEDLLFNLRYVAYCKSIVINKSRLYGYRQRAGSAVHCNSSIKWFSNLKAYRELVENYSENRVYPYLLYYYLKNLYEARYLIRLIGMSEEDIKINVFSEIKRIEEGKKIIPFKKKIKLFICKHFFPLVINRRRIREEISHE